MLYVKQSVLDTFKVYSNNTPNEVCGLLISTTNDNIINEFIDIPNISDDPKHFFAFSPTVFVEKYFEVNKKNGRILGVIHSHPTKQAYPTNEDIANWYYNELSYWVYSVTDGVINAYFVHNNSAYLANYQTL